MAGTRPSTRRTATTNQIKSYANDSLKNNVHTNEAKNLDVKPQTLILEAVRSGINKSCVAAAEARPSPVGSYENRKSFVTRNDGSTPKFPEASFAKIKLEQHENKIKYSDNFRECFLTCDDNRIVALSVGKGVFGKHPISFDCTRKTTITTSESADHARIVAEGHVFSDGFLEESARKVLRPSKGESIEEAIAAMRAVCIKAMSNSGEDWTSIVEGEDQYHLLVSSNGSDAVKSKIVYKSLYVLAVVDVISDTVSRRLPPTVMKSCDLGRSKALEWIGPKRAAGMWIPLPLTVYDWFREFCNHGRSFKHPMRAVHLYRQNLDRIDDYFEDHPLQRQKFKNYVFSALKEQCMTGDPCALVGDGTVEGNGYDFYCYFVNDILGASLDGTKASKANRGAKESDSEGSSVEFDNFLSEKRNHLAECGFEKLTWQHLSSWIDSNWGNTKKVTWC